MVGGEEDDNGKGDVHLGIGALRQRLFTWKQRQAEHIRLGRLFCVDFDNIAEEIGSLGKSQESELTSRYKVL